MLRTGTADFTVAQKGVSDVLYSNLDQGQIDKLKSYPQVDSVVGVLVAAIKLDDNHPFFLELGIQPNELAPFGVQVLRGRP